MFLAILADTWEIAFSTAISSVSLPPEAPYGDEDHYAKRSVYRIYRYSVAEKR